MNFREWFQALPVLLQTLFLIAVGLLIASPYWLMWIFVRRRKHVEEKDEQKFAEQQIQVSDLSDEGQAVALAWHNRSSVLILIFLSLVLISLKGFRASAGTVWFPILNVYYLWVLLVFAHKAISKTEFQRERLISPSLDRKTWILRWLPLFVLLPLMGWAANSLPIILGR